MRSAGKGRSSVPLATRRRSAGGFCASYLAIIHWTATAISLNPDHADPLALRLNGLPPGVPVTGDLTLDATGNG